MTVVESFLHPIRLRCNLSKLMALHRSRVALAALDDDRLRDLGIDKTAAEDEAKRPFWDAPDAWKSL